VTSLRLLRRLAPAAVIALALYAAEPTQAAAREDAPYASWFRHSEEVLANWMIEPLPGDPMQVVIRHRNPFQNTKAPRVLVLYPRPSSA
jgi:hypothetical protein